MPDLDTQPYSCWEAACYRNISLEEELKTLLVYGKNGIVALHLLGHCNVNPNLLSSYLVKFRLLPRSTIHKYHLKPGAINPFNIVKLLKDDLSIVIISPLVFSKKYVYTNNGTHYESIRFDPTILLTLYSRAAIINFDYPASLGITKANIIFEIDDHIQNST